MSRCFDLSRDIDLHPQSAAQTREAAIAGVHFGIRQRLTAKITEFDRPYRFVDEMVQGAFKRFRHTHRFSEANGGTLIDETFDYTSPLGLLGRIADMLFLQGYMYRFLQRRNAYLKQVAEAQ
jgi:ligand-binding SRPBCC domain-containing protein